MSAEGPERREWKRIELQLDTAQILLVIAMLLGLCASSFYLGRWIERDRWNGGNGAGPGRASLPGTIGGTDAAQDLTFFDTLGGKTSAEPARQAHGTAGSAHPSASAAKAEVGTAGAAESAEGIVEPVSPGPASPGADDQGSVRAPGPGASPSGGAPPASNRTNPSSVSGTSSASGPAVSSPVKGTFAVQVFSGEKAQAEKIAASLARKGYAARTTPAAPGSTAVRVRLFGYRTRAEADRAAARLKAEDHLSAWVVKAD